MDAALKAKTAKIARIMAHKHTASKSALPADNSFERAMAPDTMNADLMAADEIHRSLEEGYRDAMSGRVRDAAEVFAELREHMIQ